MFKLNTIGKFWGRIKEKHKVKNFPADWQTRGQIRQRQTDKDRWTNWLTDRLTDWETKSCGRTDWLTETHCQTRQKQTDKDRWTDRQSHVDGLTDRDRWTDWLVDPQQTHWKTKNIYTCILQIQINNVSSLPLGCKELVWKMAWRTWHLVKGRMTLSCFLNKLGKHSWYFLLFLCLQKTKYM